MLTLEERKKLSPHELNPSRDTPEVIYHYTDRETTRKILTKGVVLSDDKSRGL